LFCLPYGKLRIPYGLRPDSYGESLIPKICLSCEMWSLFHLEGILDFGSFEVLKERFNSLGDVVTKGGDQAAVRSDKC
jgi:hypothetical protein